MTVETTTDLAKALRQADMLDQGPAHRNFGVADMLRALVAEVQRLNQWADGFTDAHLKERQTGDALVKEQAARLDDYVTEINRLRNVIQAACTGGLGHMLERWKQLFPDAPVPTVHAIPAPEGGELTPEQNESALATALQVANKNGVQSYTALKIIAAYQADVAAALAAQVADDDLSEIEAWAMVDRKTILPADLFHLRNVLAYMVREVRTARSATLPTQIVQAPAEAHEPQGLMSEAGALRAYLADCDNFAIVPDVAGAFHFAWAQATIASQAQPKGTDARESDKQLMDFYSVETLHDLIGAQERHIVRLQAKLPSINQPAFTRVREG